MILRTNEQGSGSIKRRRPNSDWQRGSCKVAGILATGIAFASPMVGVPGSARADVVVFRIGDNDDFGGWNGSTIPFDTRDASDLSATNGAQFTDVSLSLAGGASIPFSLSGQYPAGGVLGALITISGAGFDTGNTYDVSIVSSAGSAVIGTMPTTSDPLGQTVFDDFSVPSNLLYLLNNADAPLVEVTALNADNFVAFNYMSGVITLVPEPSTLVTSLIGLSALCSYAAYRRSRACPA